MDFWRTQPAHVEVKRAAKKRSAAKSKPVPNCDDQPVAPPQMDVDLELPSGNEAASESGHREGVQAVAALNEDDAPMSLPSPAPTNDESLPPGPEGLPRKRPAASSSRTVLKRPAAALRRPAASMSLSSLASMPSSSNGPVPVAPMPSSPAVPLPAAAAAPVPEAPPILPAEEVPAAPAAPAAPAVPAAAPVAGPGPVAPNPADGSTTLRIRGQLSIVLPAGVTVGCPKCRDSRVGCATCRRAKGFTLENSAWVMI